MLSLFEGGPIEFANPIGIGQAASLLLATFAEFFCALFLIFGFATRFAVVPLIITMIVAGFIIHADDGYFVKEKAFMFLSVFITFAIAGAGKFSVDNLIYRKIKS